MPMLYSGAEDGLLEGPTWVSPSFQLYSNRRNVHLQTAYTYIINYYYTYTAYIYSGRVKRLMQSEIVTVLFAFLQKGAYWTQNSYGTAMTTLPFLGDLGFKGMKESQNWWFNNMADGTQAYAGGTQGWAPDGCGCDNGEPSGCNYKYATYPIRRDASRLFLLSYYLTM